MKYLRNLDSKTIGTIKFYAALGAGFALVAYGLKKHWDYIDQLAEADPEYWKN